MSSKNGIERRSQIIAAAQKLFFTKGYESTSIDDIANEVGVSKGAFYHYFDSKHAVVLGVADSFLEAVLSGLKQIVANPSLNAIEKFNAFFRMNRSINGLELEQVWASMNVLYQPENIRLRHWLEARQKELMTPEFAKIIDQGRNEGLIDVANSAFSAEFFLAIAMVTEATLFELVIDTDRPENALTFLKEKYDLAESALERILAIPAGSFDLVDIETLALWLAEHE